jgi:cell division protein FtsQ
VLPPVGRREARAGRQRASVSERAREKEPLSAIDPRIRQRRIEVKRNEGRRRLKILVAVLSVLLVTGTAFVAMRSPFLDVDRLAITSGPHTSPRAVTAAAGVPRHRPLIDIDTTAVARRIRTLPWVRSVSVRRQWPGTVEITVVERTAAAAVPAAAGGWALVDAGGWVLERMAAPPPGVVPVVDVAPVGAPGTTVWRSVRDSLTVAAALPPALIPKVAGVGPGPDGEVQLHLKPAGLARLGPPAELAAKLSSLAVVLDHVPLTGAGAVAVIDVRVPTAPVVTRVPASLTPPQSGR